MGYVEGFGSSNYLGVLYVLCAALGSATYQVCSVRWEMGLIDEKSVDLNLSRSKFHSSIE